MAYVPEEALDRHDEVTGNAFKLFVYYCSKADKETGESFYKSEDIATKMKWKKNHIYEHRKALAEAHWIAINADHVKVLFGFPRPKSKSENGTKASPKTGLAKSENRTSIVPAQVQKQDSISPKIVPAESENGTSQVRKRDFPIKEEPDQLTRPINQTKEPSSEPDDSPKADKATLEKIFFEKYEVHYQAKYQSKAGDFVQLNATIRAQAQILTVVNWTLATENYFKSEFGVHTLAQLSTLYPSLMKYPVDRYKQPIKGNGYGNTQQSGTGTGQSNKYAQHSK
jgi:hypothetical protein